MNASADQSAPAKQPAGKPAGKLAEMVGALRAHVELERSFGLTDCQRRAPSALERKTQALRRLEEATRPCRRCPLHGTRQRLVFGEGNPDAELMFVGEAPGHDEDVQGRPFVGRAGQLLTRIIEAMGMRREDVYIANVLKCRPPENRTPALEEMTSCGGALIQQIEIIQPKIVVALGAVAVRFLLGVDRPMSSLRGTFHDYRGAKLMATYHPAYLLRNPAAKRDVREDMKKVLKALESK